MGDEHIPAINTHIGQFRIPLRISPAVEDVRERQRTAFHSSRQTSELIVILVARRSLINIFFYYFSQ